MKDDKKCNCPEESMEELNIESSSESTPQESLENTDSFSESFGPELLPPDEEEGNETEGFGAGVWHQNKKVTSLWAKDETRNSWAAISGMGWKKLNSSNNSSCVALSILAAHAKQYNRNTKININGGQIKEIYVW
ncbi:hypothetical protein [Polaribacter sp.]|uniref:hypothetical protein n=1 Tax=Polaribacter sp. TaxID=1920175 RepID=UPI003EF2B273